MIEVVLLIMLTNMYPLQTIDAAVMIHVLLALIGEVKHVVMNHMVEIVLTLLVNA